MKAGELLSYALLAIALQSDVEDLLSVRCANSFAQLRPGLLCEKS